MDSLVLQPHMKKAIEAGSSGLDVMHGHLKVLMLDAEEQLTIAQEEEERTEEAIDSMERRYWEGWSEAMAYLYSLTYALSFAEAERDNK